MTRPNASRRQFLRNAALTSIVGPAGAPFALNLATISAASAQSAPEDYRALVCIFLFGGNDQGNTVLATDPTSWAAYTAARSTAPSPIVLPAVGTTGGVLPIVPNTLQAGREFALHPSLTEIKTLFDAGRGAVIANVGPLIAPTTKSQYQGRTVPMPANLFSHNDQQSTWQSFKAEGARVGWGGRMGDLFASMNSFTTFTCISASGNAVWLSGQTTLQYQVGSNGGVSIGSLTGGLFGSTAAANPLRAILTSDRANVFEKEHAKITERAITAQTTLNTSMLPAATLNAIQPLPANNSLATQLQTVARIIGGRTALGAKRQVFFVSIGGFDTHDNQLPGHANLMARLGEAMAYFDRLMASPAINAADKVTQFTASDFGRTLTSNGDGTDHGWGGHHFVVGAAVKGKDVYGRFPEIGVNTADDVGQGRLLPTTSVDQYGGTLARWFGLTDGQIADIFPNLKNFGSAANLGFML